MVLTVITGYSPEHAERLRSIMSGVERQNVISYQDHQQHEYLVAAEQVAELGDALRDAGFGQWWLTR
jgi:hypothetical protein